MDYRMELFMSTTVPEKRNFQKWLTSKVIKNHTNMYTVRTIQCRIVGLPYGMFYFTE